MLHFASGVTSSAYSVHRKNRRLIAAFDGSRCVIAEHAASLSQKSTIVLQQMLICILDLLDAQEAGTNRES